MVDGMPEEDVTANKELKGRGSNLFLCGKSSLP